MFPLIPAEVVGVINTRPANMLVMTKIAMLRFFCFSDISFSQTQSLKDDRLGGIRGFRLPFLGTFQLPLTQQIQFFYIFFFFLKKRNIPITMQTKIMLITINKKLGGVAGTST